MKTVEDKKVLSKTYRNVLTCYYLDNIEKANKKLYMYRLKWKLCYVNDIITILKIEEIKLKICIILGMYQDKCQTFFVAKEIFYHRILRNKVYGII